MAQEGTQHSEDFEHQNLQGRISFHLQKRGVTHLHTGSTGSVAGSLVDSYTCTHPPGSDNHADICGYPRTHPCLFEINIQEGVCQSLVLSNKLPIANHSALGCVHTFTGLRVRIQCIATLAVAIEAPWAVLADTVGATQIGVC